MGARQEQEVARVVLASSATWQTTALWRLDLTSQGALGLLECASAAFVMAAPSRSLSGVEWVLTSQLGDTN